MTEKMARLGEALENLKKVELELSEHFGINTNEADVHDKVVKRIIDLGVQLRQDPDCTPTLHLATICMWKTAYNNYKNALKEVLYCQE